MKTLERRSTRNALLVASVIALACGARESPRAANPVVVPARPLVALPAPAFITLDPRNCALIGLPARIGRVLVLEAGHIDMPTLFRIHLDTGRPSYPDSLNAEIDACCEGDTNACEGFALAVDEQLVDVTTLDVVPRRDRDPSYSGDDEVMMGGPSFAYSECDDDDRTRTLSPSTCAYPEEASYFHVYAEFVASGRPYRLLVDRQWDVFRVLPPRVERFHNDRWVLVNPVVEGNTQEQDCLRYHYGGDGYGAYWSEDTKVLVIGYGLEGASQSLCEPGDHYAAYSL